jgi:hypothetical protein
LEKEILSIVLGQVDDMLTVPERVVVPLGKVQLLTFLAFPERMWVLIFHYFAMQSLVATIDGRPRPPSDDSDRRGEVERQLA